MITDAAIREHEPLIGMVITRMRRAGQLVAHVEDDDLMQVGRIAVWKALQRYRPEGGAFSSFAWQTIWGEIMRYQRDSSRAQGWHRVHGQIAQIDSLHQSAGNGQAIGETLVAPDDTERAALARVRLSAMRRCARGFAPRDRVAAAVVLTDRPQMEISAVLGCSQMTASRMARRVAAVLAGAAARA